MHPFKFRLSSVKARVASAAFGLVSSVASLSAVFLMFASASGELDLALASLTAARSASAVAGKAPARLVCS